MFDTAKAKKMFLEFLEAEASVPDDEKSDQTLIYSYNAWSQIAAIEINSNKNQQMAMGVEYMLKAVQRELEVLDMPATQNMRLEIVSDLSQDAMNGFKVCSKLGNQEQAVLFMKAITIAKYLSR